MLKKTILISITVLSCCTALFYAMQRPDSSVQENTSKLGIKIQPILNPAAIVIPNDSAGFLQDGFEMLNVLQDEPILFTSFQELIQLSKDKNVPFILAVVSQKGYPARRAYYDALSLNKILFGDFVRAANTYVYEKDKQTLDAAAFKDPYTLQEINTIQYFLIEQDEDIPLFLGTDVDLTSSDPAKEPLSQVFAYYDYAHNTPDADLTIFYLILTHYIKELEFAHNNTGKSKLNLMLKYVQIASRIQDSRQKVELGTCQKKARINPAS